MYKNLPWHKYVKFTYSEKDKKIEKKSLTLF